MPFTLSDVSDWEEGLSCVLTALSALNGQTPRQIHDVLRGIARRDGREIGTEFRADYCINDWLAAVNELGGQWAPSVDHSALRSSALVREALQTVEQDGRHRTRLG
jgi:hypothetical protein